MGDFLLNNAEIMGKYWRFLFQGRFLLNGKFLTSFSYIQAFFGTKPIPQDFSIARLFV